MTTDKKIARCKLNLLELSAELQNVNKTCQPIGYSRQQFYEILYEIRLNFQTYSQVRPLAR